jgi:hypothetical protein
MKSTISNLKTHLLNNMPARKIPIVWSNPKAKDQKYSKYDAASGRLVQFGCDCRPPPPPPLPPLPDSIQLQYVSSGTFTYLIPTLPDIYKWTLNYEIRNAGQGGGGGGTASLTLSGGGGGAGASGPIITGTFSLPYGAGGFLEVLIAPFGLGGPPGLNGLTPLFDATLKIDANLIATSSTPTLNNAGQNATGNPVPGISSGNGGTGGTGGIGAFNIGSAGQQGGIGYANVTITAGL